MKGYNFGVMGDLPAKLKASRNGKYMHKKTSANAEVFCPNSENELTFRELR